jgi:hypothetical protein
MTFSKPVKTFEDAGADRFKAPFAYTCLANVYMLLVLTYTYLSTIKILTFTSYATENEILKQFCKKG